MEVTFPYVNAYGSINNLFSSIKSASVPPKFSQNFLSTMLGLKSSSHRALIPFLKKLDFIDEDNVPTEIYKQYRGSEMQSKKIMAQAIKKGYADLFTSDEYAYRLDKDKLRDKIKTITGMSAGNTLEAIVNSFMQLVSLADFTLETTTVEEPKKIEPKSEQSVKQEKEGKNITGMLGLSYTINLNLPATTDIDVFNAIFKSLKENLLDE